MRVTTTRLRHWKGNMTSTEILFVENSNDTVNVLIHSNIGWMPVSEGTEQAAENLAKEWDLREASKEEAEQYREYINQEEEED